MPLDASTALGGLPSTLRGELLAEYDKITRNYRESRWEASELDGGRFCEIVYSILRGRVDGQYPAQTTKPSRFPDACDDLAQTPKASQPQSVRVTIPRVLVGLYEIRNNRGVGHVGAEVDANHMDSTYVLHAVQWVMAELVRLYHSTDIATATAVVDALVNRTLPFLWQVGDVTRILQTGMKLADQTLLLLYGDPNSLSDQVLATNLEQPRLANYKRVLQKLHDERQLEYDGGTVTLSPKGTKYVEEKLLPKLAS